MNDAPPPEAQPARDYRDTVFLPQTGFPMRGAIAAIATERGALRVTHGEIPGVLAAGAHEFRAAPGVLAAVAPGRQFFGRIERRDGAWWVFDVRLVVAPRENK